MIHDTAVVDDGAIIGDGTRIWHFSHIMRGAVIGKNCIIGQGCFVGNVRIGDGCKVQNGVNLYDGVSLFDDVFVGPCVTFTNVINPRANVERKHEYRTTLVKTGASIGANATIICGVTIGRYAMVGAGAVVTKDVPDHAVVVGIPARVVDTVCACGRERGKMSCAFCVEGFTR